LFKVWFGKLWRYVFLFAIVITFFSSIVLANVVVFDKYETTYTMQGDSLMVDKKLRIKNIGNNPIIPGEIHFKLSQQQGSEAVPAVIRNLDITDHYGNTLDTKQIKGKNELDIIFTIWDPLLPSFYLDFQMEYEIDFKPKGLLFYEINIPTEKTTITIREQHTEFMMPKRYHITYAPEGKVEAKEGARVITWNDMNQLEFEYSLIPLPKLGVRMVNVFWIALITISLLYLVIRFVRSSKQVDEY
jgi:hypothetical protein